MLEWNTITLFKNTWLAEDAFSEVPFQLSHSCSFRQCCSHLPAFPTSSVTWHGSSFHSPFYSAKNPAVYPKVIYLVFPLVQHIVSYPVNQPISSAINVIHYMLLYTKAHYTPKSRAEKLHTTDIKQDLMHLHRAPVTLLPAWEMCTDLYFYSNVVEQDIIYSTWLSKKWWHKVSMQVES